MILTAIGVALALAPVLAAPLFGAGKRGVVTVAALALAWHVSLAVSLQALGVFSYGAVLAANVAAVAGLLSWARRRGALAWPSCCFAWFPAATFALAAAFLLGIHFWYSGPVDTAVGLRVVSRSASPYPFYSDEWVAIVLANQSIETGGLPTVNPLEGGKPFANFLAGFHAAVAGALLLLNLTPLTGYVWLAVANGLAICALAFSALRILGVGASPSALAAFSVLLVTNSGNLPGIWNLLPFTLSLTALLLALVAGLSRSTVGLAAAVLAAAAVYPPSAFLALPIVLGLAAGHDAALRRRALAMVFCALALAATVLLAASGAAGPVDLLARAWSFLVRPSLDPGHVTYLPWRVIPLFALPFAVLGIFEIFRRRLWSLAAPLSLAALAWIAYSLAAGTVVALEPSRVVIFAAVLSSIAAGFGFDRAWRALLARLGAAADASASRAAKIVSIFFLVAAAAFSSYLGQWHKNVLVVPPTGVEGRESVLTPAPPVTRYLTEDDLRIFSGAAGERVIAPAWKGLVLAAAVGVVPLESKPSTISNRRLPLADFLEADCAARSKMAEREKVGLVYSPEFSCPGFVEFDRSAEGLVAYRVE